MTTLKFLPLSEITVRAKKVRFSQIVLAVVLWLCWVPGFVLGRVWLVLVIGALWVWHNGLVIFAIAVRRGWRDGTGWDVRQTEKSVRQAAAGSRSQDNSKV